MSEPLQVYLSNHLAGARAGARLFRRAAKHFGGTPRADLLNRLGDDVAEDLEELRRLMSSCGVRENRLLSAAAIAAQQLGALKPNGRLLTRSPLTYLLEVEALRDAVHAKRSGWQALRSAAASDPGLPDDLLEKLESRAEEQAARLRELQADVAREVLPRRHQA